MKINITKSEYRLLLEALYLASWMMNAHDYEMKDNDHAKFRDKIFSYFKEMEAEDYIAYDKELDGHFELAAFDEAMHRKYIDMYNTNNFWEELLERLATRDLINEFGEDHCQSMDFIERSEKIDAIRERYENEFEKNGISNIRVPK